MFSNLVTFLHYYSVLCSMPGYGYSESELEEQFEYMWDELYSALISELDASVRFEYQDEGQVHIRWQNYPYISVCIEHDDYGFLYDAYGQPWRSADKLAEKLATDHFSES